MSFVRKKKKGSSLLTTVAMMGILSIIIISILAMTTAGYKMRKESNKRTENFYGAESGLEISERVLINYIEATVDYANKEVDRVVGTAPSNNPTSMAEKNRIFKRSFIDFFKNGGKSEKKRFYDDSSFAIETEYKEITNEIKNQEYYKSVNRDDVKIYESSLAFKDKDKNDITGNQYEEIKSMKLNVKSEYIKDEKDRKVGVDFDIEIPDYGKEIVQVSGATSPAIFNYVVGADGSYRFNFDGSATIYGDIWVKGERKDDEIQNLNNKYESGVFFATKNSAQVPKIGMIGGIATGGTINIKNVSIDTDPASIKEFYARNFKVENTLNEIVNTELSDTDVYVYNDMFLKGDKNTVNMNNFYGLNEIDEGKYKEYGLDEISRSSSIIIETGDSGSDTSSKLKVLKDAYILGTAYVDLEGEAYKTGQSNSVNRLTKPYTIREEGKYIYDYKGNLHLIDSKVDGSKIEVSEKAALLQNYVLTTEEQKLANVLDVSGKIYSTGAILEGGNIKPPTYQNILRTTVEDKQKEFVKEVFNMGEGELSEYSVNEFWANKIELSVEESFRWENFDDAIIKAKTNANLENLKHTENNKFAAFSTKLTVKELIDKAKNDSSKIYPLEAYGSSSSEKPLIILSSDDRKIIIQEVDDSDKDVGLVIEDKVRNTIVYKVKKSDRPILIIANSDIEQRVKHNIYSMSITTGDITCNAKTGVHLGNYNSQSGPGVPGYAAGQFNLINELFKYIMEDSSLLGDIGENIFGGSENKEIIESIEISDVIKKNNWKLIK